MPGPLLHAWGEGVGLQPNLEKRVSPKLTSQWLGPCEVLEQLPMLCIG